MRNGIRVALQGGFKNIHVEGDNKFSSKQLTIRSKHHGKFKLQYRILRLTYKSATVSSSLIFFGKKILQLTGWPSVDCLFNPHQCGTRSHIWIFFLFSLQIIQGEPLREGLPRLLYLPFLQKKQKKPIYYLYALYFKGILGR